MTEKWLFFRRFYTCGFFFFFFFFFGFLYKFCKGQFFANFNHSPLFFDTFSMQNSPFFVILTPKTPENDENWPQNGYFSVGCRRYACGTRNGRRRVAERFIEAIAGTCRGLWLSWGGFDPKNGDFGCDLLSKCVFFALPLPLFDFKCHCHCQLPLPIATAIDSGLWLFWGGFGRKMGVLGRIYLVNVCFLAANCHCQLSLSTATANCHIAIFATNSNLPILTTNCHLATLPPPCHTTATLPHYYQTATLPTCHTTAKLLN
jgi:hypothetical protein